MTVIIARAISVIAIIVLPLNSHAQIRLQESKNAISLDLFSHFVSKNAILKNNGEEIFIKPKWSVIPRASELHINGNFLKFHEIHASIDCKFTVSGILTQCRNATTSPRNSEAKRLIILVARKAILDSEFAKNNFYSQLNLSLTIRVENHASNINGSSCDANICITTPVPPPPPPPQKLSP